MSGRGQNKGKHSLCFACDEPSNVYLDSQSRHSADYCDKCLFPNLTWEEARSGMYYFNKKTLVRLNQLTLIAYRMTDYNRRTLEWEEKYGKPYGLDAVPSNVVREKKHMDKDWYPELHEICHLAWM